MNRTILIPVIALLALIIKEVSGVELDSLKIDIIIEGILGLVGIVGIFMNPKKEK